MAIKWYLIGEDTTANNAPAYDVVFHADVPDQSNVQGYSIRSQVTESMNPESTRVPWLVGTQTETDMINGLIYEASVRIASYPGETLSQLVTRVDALAAGRGTALLDELLAGNYGFERTVP